MTEQQQTAAVVPAEPVRGLAIDDGGTVSVFSGSSAFEAAQRMAKALTCSTLMPQAYQGQKGLPNVLIAMELASRIGASVLMVAQNLDIIHGRPSWRAQFLIATVNGSNRFSPLRYRMSGTEGRDDWGCRCVAKDVRDGEELVGPLVTIAMAKKEGWYDKSGSKWKTLPELMLCYRAAAFWTRLHAPELSLGISTDHEVIDTWGTTMPDGVRSGDPAELEAVLRAAPQIAAEPARVITYDQETGEVDEEDPEPGSDG